MVLKKASTGQKQKFKCQKCGEFFETTIVVHAGSLSKEHGLRRVALVDCTLCKHRNKYEQGM